MNFNFNNVLELLTSFQATFFALYLLSNTRKEKLSNVLIASFLLLLAVNISHNYISLFLDQISLNLTAFVMMTAYLMAPILYLHIKTSLISDYQLSWKDSIHLLPFVLFNLAIIPSVYVQNLGPETVNEELENYINQLLYIGFYIQFFIYLASGFYFLWKTKGLYVENYSNNDTRRFNYLLQLNSIVSVVILASALKNYIIFSQDGNLMENSIYVVLLMILIMFCWIILKGLSSPELFNTDISNLRPVSDLINEEKEYEAQNSSIKPQVLDEISEIHLKKVEGYMEENQPFLDASLSLSDLASQTNIPVRELSLLINHSLKQHFFDFVNAYRIHLAQKLLIDPDRKGYTVLEILYEVGFNSKSSFNTAFKKVTGLTPTQYRKDQLSLV